MTMGRGNRDNSPLGPLNTPGLRNTPGPLDSLGRIRSARELREMFARQRLEADIRDTLSPANLLSMVVPPGSLFDRLFGRLIDRLFGR